MKKKRIHKCKRQNKLPPDGGRTNPSIWICFLSRSLSPRGGISFENYCPGVPFQACSTDYAIGYASVCWAVYLATICDQVLGLEFGPGLQFVAAIQFVVPLVPVGGRYFPNSIHILSKAGPKLAVCVTSIHL